MSFFTVDPETQREDWLQKVKSAETLVGLAEQAYRKDPSRANRIALQAAIRLLRESQAQLQEWMR